MISHRIVSRIRYIAIGLHAAAVLDVTRTSLTISEGGEALHGDVITILLRVRSSFKGHVAAVLRNELIANGGLTIGDDSRIPVPGAIPTAVMIAVMITVVIPVAVVPAVVIPIPSVIAAIVVAAVPHDVAGITFRTPLRIVHADHGNSIVVVGRLEQGLRATAVNTFEAEVNWIPGQGLIAIEPAPRHSSATLPTETAFAPSNFDVSGTVEINLKRAFSTASTSGNPSLDHLIPLCRKLSLREGRELCQPNENEKNKTVRRFEFHLSNSSRL